MSTSISVEEVQAKLPELIAQLTPGEEVVITQNAQPVAKLHLITPKKPRPRFGNCQGMLTILAEDEEYLEDFKEYMS